MVVWLFLIYLFIFGCLMLFVQEFALDRLTDFEKMLEAVSAACVSYSQLQLHCSSSSIHQKMDRISYLEFLTKTWC